MGMGSQFGSANTAGAYQTTVNTGILQDQNKRAQEQHDAKKVRDDLYNNKMIELSKQEQVQGGAAQELQTTVEAQGKELKDMKQKQAGDVVKNATNYGAANPTPQASKDGIEKIENNADAMKSIGMKKGDIRVADTMDRDAIAKTYMAGGIGQEEAYRMADESLKQGASLIYQNSQVIDIFQLNEVMGTSKNAVTPVNDAIEKNKAKIVNAGKPLKEAESTETPASKGLTDQQLADTGFSKEEIAAMRARTTELGKMTNAEAQADLQVTPDLQNENSGQVDTTKNVDGSQANIPETTPYNVEVQEGDSSTTVESVSLPNGSSAKVQTNTDGSKTSSLTDGSTITVKKDGSATATEPNGRKSQVAPDGKVTTVAADGTVTQGYRLPPSVQMAADALGIDSAYTNKVKSAAGQFAHDYVSSGSGTFKDGLDLYAKTNAKTKTALTPSQQAAKNATDEYKAIKNPTQADRDYRDKKLKEAANLKDTKTTDMNAEQAAVASAKAQFLKDGDVNKYNKAVKDSANLKDVKPTNPNEAQILWDEVDGMIKRDDFKTDAEYNKARTAKYKELKFKPQSSSDKNITRAQTAQNEVDKMTKKSTETDAQFTARKDKRYVELMSGAPTETNIQSLERRAKAGIAPKGVVESEEAYQQRVNDEIIRLDRNKAKDPTPAKKPDKTAMNETYQKKRGNLLNKLDSKRLNTDTENYKEGIRKWADLTPAEWANLNEQEYNDIKMAYNNTRSELTADEKKQLKNTSQAMQSFDTISKTYNPKQSGWGQNLLNYMGQFTGLDGLSSADISSKAELNSAIASLVVSEATEIGGRPSTYLVKKMEEEIGKLNYSDKAVLGKFSNAIDKTIATLEAQKKSLGDGYYLQYKGDPLERMKNIKRNLSLANGETSVVNTGDVELNEAQTTTQSNLFPKRK